MKYRTWVGLTGGNTVTVTEWKSIYCEKNVLLFLLLPTNINSFFFLALEQSNTANAWKCNENMREGLWHREDLYRLVVQLGLQLLWISHLPHSLHEVFLGDILTVRADGKQTCKQTQHESADHRQRGLTKLMTTLNERLMSHLLLCTRFSDQLHWNHLTASQWLRNLKTIRRSQLERRTLMTLRKKKAQRGCISWLFSLSINLLICFFLLFN